MYALDKPRDAEDALRADLGALLEDYRVFAPPPRDDLAAGDVLVTRVGGIRLSSVTQAHRMSIDCWADDDEQAVIMANDVCGALTALPLTDGTLTDWKTASADLPYLNPDPKRPTLPRATFTCEVVMRGEPIFE